LNSHRAKCGLWLATVGLVTSAATTAATAAVAAASAAATTAAVAAATTTAAATATGPLFAGPGFVHSQGASVVLGAIDAGDRRLSFSVASHFHKAKALASASIAIIDHFSALHSPKLGKQLVQI
jgi:hypothetical protein